MKIVNTPNRRIILVGEEYELYNKLKEKSLPKNKLSERERQLATYLTSKGVLVRFRKAGVICYKLNRRNYVGS